MQPGACEVADLQWTRVLGLPLATEYGSRGPALENGARPLEPPTDPDVVIGAREIADDEGQKVHARRDRVRGLSLAPGIPGHARWRDADEADELIAPEHVEQAPPLGRRQGEVDSHRPRTTSIPESSSSILALESFPTRSLRRVLSRATT